MRIIVIKAGKLFLICILLILTFASISGFTYIKRYDSINDEKGIIPVKGNSAAFINDTKSSMFYDRRKISARIRIPILEYHCINDRIIGIESLYVSPREFQKQMEYLKRNNYTVITFEQLGNPEKLKKPVMITFDDGYEDNYYNAYPILRMYGFKTTIFLIANAIDHQYHLKKYQIQMMKNLVSFQSHTLSHPHLSRLRSEQIDKELYMSKKIIESLTGKKVDVLAYPFGDYDSNVMNVAKKYYKFAVRSGGGIYYEDEESNYEIKRITVNRKTSIPDFQRSLEAY